jgi:opacity protein-like surface antigen
MIRSLLLLVPAVLLLTTAAPAEAALPIGLDIAAGAGGSGSFDRSNAGFDLHLRGELRLGFFTIGASLKERPPLPKLTPANRLMIYGDLGFNIPLPKCRIIFRAGVGGGTQSAGVGPLFGIHETVGFHLFALDMLGIGFEVDLDQTLLVDAMTWDHGLGGRIMLLFRI